MRIETPLSPNDFGELKKESKEVLGVGGHLSPPFGQSTNDYVEVHLLDTNGTFIEKFNSNHTSFEDDMMILNIGQDLRDRDYNRGEFKVRYNFIRKVAGGDEIVLTKTVDGQPNLIHSGNPELTGVPMGKFFTDQEGNAFIGESPPSNMQDAVPLDIKEWKFKVDEISPSRTEVRIVPQLINNVNYIKEFRDLIDPKRYVPETAWAEYVEGDTGLRGAWNIISTNPNDPLSKWWRPRLQFQDNVTKKSDFGKLHWNLFGKDEPNRSLPTQDGGGQISWTGPDSSRLEFNVRREVEDEGFKDTMKGSTITIEKAYIVDYESRPDIDENSDYQQEDAIPDLYIQVVRVENTKTFNYSMYTMDGDVYDPNSQGVQFYWEFGCGHRQDASAESNASHNYDTEGTYQPSVIVMTPNFQSEVTELRTPNGRILDYVEIGTPESTNAPLIENSSLDGKIIRWNCNTSQGIPRNRSTSRSTTSSRWYIQNGYRRLITNGTNLGILRTLLGSTIAQDSDGNTKTVSRFDDVNNVNVDVTLFNPLDIELDAVSISDFPIGPDIDATAFTTGVSINESLPTPDMGQKVFLGLFESGQEETENEVDDEFGQEEETDEGQDDSSSDGNAFTVTLVNSPIAMSQGLAGSEVAFQGGSYINTNTQSQIQQVFQTGQIVSFKGKGMGAMGVNPFAGFFDDENFSTPSFSPQPDADELVDIFLDSNRTFYVKVESGF